LKKSFQRVLEFRVGLRQNRGFRDEDHQLESKSIGDGHYKKKKIRGGRKRAAGFGLARGSGNASKRSFHYEGNLPHQGSEKGRKRQPKAGKWGRLLSAGVHTNPLVGGVVGDMGVLKGRAGLLSKRKKAGRFGHVRWREKDEEHLLPKAKLRSHQLSKVGKHAVKLEKRVI